MKYVIIFAIAATVLAGSCGQSCCQDLVERSPMTFRYYQNSGRFFGGSGTSLINTKGYSGAEGVYRNNPDYQCTVNKGPAPANVYKIVLCKNTMHNPPVDRPCSFWIEGQDSAKMCGRSEIFIHGCQCCKEGDTTQPPIAGCSAGCIIINEANRKKLRVGDTIIVENYDPLGDNPMIEETE